MFWQGRTPALVMVLAALVAAIPVDSAQADVDPGAHEVSRLFVDENAVETFVQPGTGEEVTVTGTLKIQVTGAAREVSAVQELMQSDMKAAMATSSVCTATSFLGYPYTTWEGGSSYMARAFAYAERSSGCTADSWTHYLLELQTYQWVTRDSNSHTTQPGERDNSYLSIGCSNTANEEWRSSGISLEPAQSSRWKEMNCNR